MVSLSGKKTTRVFSVLYSSFQLVCGGLAGSTAALFTTPFDVVKTRLQTQVIHSVFPFLLAQVVSLAQISICHIVAAGNRDQFKPSESIQLLYFLSLCTIYLIASLNN